MPNDIPDTKETPPLLIGRPLAYHMYEIHPDQNGRVYCGQCRKTIGSVIIVQEMTGTMPAAGVYCEPCANAYGDWQRVSR